MAAKKRAANKPIREVIAQVILSNNEHGGDQPVLMVTTETADVLGGLRYSRALALWAASQTELALARAGDPHWTVNEPQWLDEHRINDGWRATWVVRLDGTHEAMASAAMQALDEVVERLGSRMGAGRVVVRLGRKSRGGNTGNGR